MDREVGWILQVSVNGYRKDHEEGETLAVALEGFVAVIHTT